MGYKIDFSDRRVRGTEDGFFGFLFVLWTTYFLYCAWFKKPQAWEKVMKSELKSEELMDESAQAGNAEWGGVRAMINYCNDIPDFLHIATRATTEANGRLGRIRGLCVTLLGWFPPLFHSRS